jgi:hypothetical protein
MVFTHLLPPADLRSLCPLSSAEFVEPPPKQNSWVHHWVHFPPLCEMLYACHAKTTVCWSTVGACHHCVFAALEATGPLYNWTNMCQTEAFCIKEILSTASALVCMSTTSSFSHCYCVERTRLTGALLILMELDSVFIQWIRQETSAPHWKKLVIFIPTFI